jgi:carbon-monoxide dehydrogenase medium subunit
MVRQHALEVDPVVRDRAPILAEALGTVAHLQIRTRGTVGGSLAHADPAAELPAAMLALRAGIVVGRAGATPQTIAAAAFFRGPHTTSLEPGAMVLGVEIPPLPPGTGWSFQEVARTHGAFALVGVAALVHMSDDGVIDLIRLALCGVGGAPYAPEWLDEIAVGEVPDAELLHSIGERVGEQIRSDGHGADGIDYRSTVAPVIVRRALAEAAERAGAPVDGGTR